METEAFKDRLLELVGQYDGRLPVIEGVVSGSLPLEHLHALGKRLYAEARAALQVKLPERLRICPLEAVHARRLWWRLLAEESGNFEAGQDHASLVAVTCRALGVRQEELDTEYDRYLPRLEPHRRAPISLEVTLLEFTQMYIDEVVLGREANRIGDALRAHYRVAEEALYYFRLHAVADIEHSDAALEVLVRYAAGTEWESLVLNRAQDCLERFPVWFDHGVRAGALT